jgi:RNA polymerase sigma-70 factor (ECF subfamily)
LGKLAEQVLVESASAGSPEAMTELVQLHSGQIYQISLKILKNRGDAEDNLQDVLCKVCANIHRFEGRSRFSTWLFRITINEALMRIRGRRSRSLTIETDLAGLESDISAAPDIKDTGPDQERRYIAKELAAKAFQGLPPSLVDMYIRHKTEGWTQRELAAEAGVTLASVKSRMFVVRGRMQERLQGLC